MRHTRPWSIGCYEVPWSLWPWVICPLPWPPLGGPVHEHHPYTFISHEYTLLNSREVNIYKKHSLQSECKSRMKPGKEPHTARDPRVCRPCARWYSDLLVSVMTLVRLSLRYPISVQTNNPRQGRSHWGCRVATFSQYLACQHIRWISIVFVNAAMQGRRNDS